MAAVCFETELKFDCNLLCKQASKQVASCKLASCKLASERKQQAMIQAMQASKFESDGIPPTTRLFSCCTVRYSSQTSRQTNDGKTRATANQSTFICIMHDFPLRFAFHDGGKLSIDPTMLAFFK